MPLKIWLPLTKDLSNYGSESMNIPSLPSTASFVDGKLGKCLTASSSTNIDFTCPGLEDILAKGKCYTLTCWVKVSSHSDWLIKLGIDNASGLWWGSNSNRWVSNDEGNGGKRITNTTISGDTANWHHIAYIIDKTTVGTGVVINYIDGELDTTYPTQTWDNSGLSPTTGTRVRINPYVAQINDIRLYDHALSKKEVQLIARGLICHYKLDGFGGLPNLYDFESIKSKWVADGTTCVDYTDPVYGNVLKLSTTITTTANKRIYRSVSNVWVNNQTYTVSFLAKASQAGAVCNMSRSFIAGDFTQDFELTTEWKNYSGQITSSGTATGGTLSFGIANANVDYYLTQVKLELGDKQTVYMPGSGDSKYIPLGYDSVTEYDVSGNGYNGTKVGTFSYSTDTARYNVSTLFTDGVNNYISAPIQLGDNKNFTMNVWVKSIDGSTGTGDYHIPINIGSGYYEFSIPNSGKFRNGFFINNSRYCDNYGDINLLDKNWHMCTATYDGTNIKRYIDGQIINTQSISGTLIIGGLTLYLGRYGTNNQYGSKNILKSDLRIYSTALTADDVKELYEVGASISDNGTVMGYSLEEV